MKTTAALLLAATLAAGCSDQNLPPKTSANQWSSTQPSAAEREWAMLTDIHQLTSGSQFERAGEAYFSHDMKWVIFQAAPRGQQNYQMYVAKLDWTNGPALKDIVRISPDGSRNTCGWFSNDGKTLIFGSTAGKDDPEEGRSGYQRSGSHYRWAFSKGMEIYRVDNWQSKLTGSSVVNLAVPENRLTDNDAYDAECVLSPDGNWLVFCSDRPGSVAATQPELRPKQLYAMNLKTNQVTPLTATQGYNGGPFFSADGKKLIYRSDRANNDLLQVYISDVAIHDGVMTLKNEKALTNDANVNWGPYPHPDGKHVLYATSKVSHGNYEIFMKRADGSRETRVTFDPGPDVLPVISPDGKWMMWSSRRGADNTTQVYIARFKLPKKN